MTTPDMWNYPDEVDATIDIVGFSIEATDGHIGHVDKANNETGSSYLIVATGPWIFGRTVMLPAGVIDRIDYDEKVVYLHRTKDAIRDAPEYDADAHEDPDYRTELGGYYMAEFGNLAGPGVPPGNQ